MQDDCGEDPYLWVELEWFDFLSVIPSILSHCQPLLLRGLVLGGFLLGGASVHFFAESLLDDLAIARHAGPYNLCKRSHELRILQIIVPVQLDNAIYGLVEGAEYVND